MTQRLRTALASPLFLVMAILISAETFFLMISGFGRYADFLSMTVNVILVVAAWILFVTKNNNSFPKAGMMCVQIWAIAKACTQLIFALAMFLNGIFLIAGSVNEFDSNAGLIIMGIVSIIFGTVIRVALALVYFIYFRLISKVIKNAADDADTEITNKHILGLIALAGFEELKIITFFIIRLIFSASLDFKGYNLYEYLDKIKEYSYDMKEMNFLAARVISMANAYNIWDYVWLIFTAGISIALCIVTFIWVKAQFNVSKKTSMSINNIKDIVD